MGTVMSASGLNTQGPTASSLRATSSGRITGGWVRAVKPPPAKGLSRGYDRKAVDALLLQCANGVDWLNGLLIGAENEIARLTADATEQQVVRPTGRHLISSSHGKRAPQPKMVAKRARLRTARPGRVRP
jgi:hypothetical protein